jgi:hypothetical protein
MNESKTTSKVVTLDEQRDIPRALTDSELDSVSGGVSSISLPAIIGVLADLHISTGGCSGGCGVGPSPGWNLAQNKKAA